MADNKKLQDTLKNILYAGIGFASNAGEATEKYVQDLVKKGKISDKEGKKIVDNFFHVAETKREELEGRLEKAVQQYGKAGLGELDKLSKRIKQLETELGKRLNVKAASAAKPAAAKKAAPKKAAKKKAAKKPAAKKAADAAADANNA
jgi:polyhydroxyalkanoate synthesis regulator phasin